MATFSAEYLRYITSDAWRELRRQKLIDKACTCELCTETNRSNDVHHIAYRNLWDCTTADLRVLCRRCHDLVHRMLLIYPSVKRMPTNDLRWKQLVALIDRHAFSAREWNPRKHRNHS